jgi:hypothetical protein
MQLRRTCWQFGDLEYFRGLSPNSLHGMTIEPSPVDAEPHQLLLHRYLSETIFGRPLPNLNRCECGVDKAGVGGLHSDWCPKWEAT